MLSKTRLAVLGLAVLALALAALAPYAPMPVQAQDPAKPQARAQDPALKLLDPQDAVLLLLDHQTGLFQTVKDIPVQQLRTNTVVLARLATLAKIPVITTASEPAGPNGPLMSELSEAAPHATYVGRKGEVSAWENPDFVQAVKATGRKTLIMAGVWTSVCVAFPAIQAKADGFNVYAVMDASGDMSYLAAETSLARMTHAGIVPTTTNVIVCEVQRTWARSDAAQYGALYSEFAPNYKAVIESYQKAQDVKGQQPKRDGK
jgi:nicotinamidase-related amidase